MAVRTYTQQLEDVQTAIQAIETGAQSYIIAGRQVTMGDLKTLYEREKHLRFMAARESRGGIRVSRAVPTDE